LGVILLHPEFVLCHILKIELVEMCEPAVPASDREMTAANDYVVGTIYMTVPAPRLFSKVPHIITTYPGESPCLGDIFNTGNKNPGGTAVITGNFSFVRYRFDDLICNLMAMVTVSAKFCENELFAHGNYWICPGSLICCTVLSNINDLEQGLKRSDEENRNISTYVCPGIWYDQVPGFLRVTAFLH
jgi:hypothetical protein